MADPTSSGLPSTGGASPFNTAIAGRASRGGESPTPDAIVDQSRNPKKDAGANTELEQVVERARKRFDYVQSVESETRQLEAEDLRFAWERGEQWNEQIRRQRELQRRPWLEFNQTRQFIKRVVNEIRQARPAISTRPASSGARQEMADIRSALIRHIEYDSNAEQAYDTAIEFAATSGRGYIRVFTDWETPTSFRQKVKIAAIANPLAVMMDPDAQLPDKSDAKYCFVTEYVDRDNFELEWGKDKSDAMAWDTDRGKSFVNWWDGDRVAVVDYFEVTEEDAKLVQLPNGEGAWSDDPQLLQMGQAGMPINTLKSETRKRRKVSWYKLSASPEPLATYEWRSKFIPIVMVVGDQMNVEGKRIYKGVTRDIRDAQMMFNYWATATTEFIALAPKAPWIGLADQFENHPEWKTSNTENHAYLAYEPVEMPDGTMYLNPPQRTEPAQPQQALMMMMQTAQDLLRQVTGIKEASLGEKTQPQDTQVALLNKQQQSDVVTYNFPDNARNSIRLVGLVVNDLIPIVYDSPRIVQQLGVDGQQTQVAVNQPQVDPMTGQQGPAFNPLTVGEFDVVVDSEPSYKTQRLKAAEEITEFMASVGDPTQRALIAPLAAKVMDWPDQLGDKIAAVLTAALPPSVQAALSGQGDPQVIMLQQQLQQAQQQMQQMGGQMQNLQIENQGLKIQVNNKQLEYQSKMAEYQGKRQDAAISAATERRGDDLQMRMAEMKDVTDKMKLYVEGLKSIPQLAQIFFGIDQRIAGAPMSAPNDPGTGAHFQQDIGGANGGGNGATA